LPKGYQGNDTDQPVHNVDIALLSELCAHERQAGGWR
jgi:hypothetical protein